MEMGCLEPNSNKETGRVKSSFFILDFFSEFNLVLKSSVFLSAIFFNSLIANPYAFLSEFFIFLNSDKKYYI
jgi:hypothetical protein